MTNKKQEIKKMFNVENEDELLELWYIYTETKYLDLKPFSYYNIGTALGYLKEKYNYNEEKIQKVLFTFGFPPSLKN